MGPRAFTRWAIAYGLPGVMLRRAARRGDLIARTAVEPALRADPFDAYDELRARGLLVTGRLATATVSHRIANEILRSDRFGVVAGASLPSLLERLYAATLDPRALGPVDPPSLLAVDPPDHSRYRRLVSRVFTARAVAGLEPRITEVADGLLRDVADADSFELVQRFAGQLPAAVIAEILGVPQSMRAQLLEWGNHAAVTLDPDLRWRPFCQATAALHAFHDWLDSHIAELRRHPGADLLSQLANDADGPERLTDVELRITALLLLGAGFETTVNLIGNAVVQLADHPDQLEALRAAPAGWGNAVEEVLRYDSPVQVTVRICKEETELAGTRIPAGRFIVIQLGGANRDPDVFRDPHVFDVTRTNAHEHLAFSSGIHYCLGASLARLEGTVGLRLLFERFPDLAVAGPPVRHAMRVLRGYESIPVTTGRRRPRRVVGCAN
jgi:hypothetical protein